MFLTSPAESYAASIPKFNTFLKIFERPAHIAFERPASRANTAPRARSSRQANISPAPAFSY
jgi:hypothetical protein